jgi:hypothetical protein
LELETSKISSIFNTKHHKIARKLTPCFLTNFNMWKLSQNATKLSRNLYEFFRNFLKVFWAKKYKKITSFIKNEKKCFKYFPQALAQKNVTKMLRKRSRTHIKISRIVVNKFGQAGVYIARKSVEHARTRGCK